MSFMLALQKSMGDVADPMSMFHTVCHLFAVNIYWPGCLFGTLEGREACLCFTLKSSPSVCELEASRLPHYTCVRWMLAQDWLANCCWCQKSCSLARLMKSADSLTTEKIHTLSNKCFTAFYCETQDSTVGTHKKKKNTLWKFALTVMARPAPHLFNNVI